MLEIPYISLSLFLTALIILGLAIHAFRNLTVQGAAEFSLLMVSLTLYIGGFGMELLTPDKNGILFWLKVQYVGIATIPALCVALAIKLAGNSEWLKWWPVRIILFLPVLILAAYFTDHWHHLFYKSIGDQVHSILQYSHELKIVKGPLYYANIVYLNLGLLASVFLFARKLKRTQPERQQALILIGGAAGPWIAHLLYQVNATNGFDISPFGFLITAPLFAWGIFGNHVVFLLPSAKNSVYQSLRDVVLILDKDRTLVDYNRSAGAIFKFLTRGATGKPVVELFASFPGLCKALNEHDIQMEQVKLRLDDRHRSFIVSSSDVRSRQEQKLGTVVVMHEITDLVILHGNLLESEERYRLIFENSPVGVFQYDTLGNITTCNKAFVKIIGSSRELLIGLNVLNLPDQELVQVVDGSLRGQIGYYDNEYHAVTSNKSTPVRGLFAPIMGTDGEILGGVGIIEDYTERRLAHRQISYKEEFERVLMMLELDFLNSDIGQFDRTFNDGLQEIGVFCRVDRACIYRFDFLAGQMFKTHEWPSDGTRVGGQQTSTIRLDLLPNWMEQVRRKEVIDIPDLDGLPDCQKNELGEFQNEGVKSLIAVPIETGGELFGFACFESTLDRRTWNKDETSLLKVVGQIFAGMIKKKEANEELITARNRAEEASRIKSTFLANMSHDLRTPLNGILGFAELIHTESQEPLIRNYSEIVLSSGNRLLQTLGQILDLSRVEADKVEMILEPIQVNQAIDEVVSLFSAMAAKKGLFIGRHPGSVNLVLNLDRQLFRNSLTNLVNNAIKFTETGSITLSTSVEHDHGKLIGIVRVSDTGIGIPEKYLETIFEDFSRVNEGLTMTFDGTGLGLSLTKKFVQLSGGEIRVESKPGSGTTFTMMFADPAIEP